MIDEKNFCVNFNLKNISVMSKFVTRNPKIKQLKNKLFLNLTHKIYRKMFVLYEFGRIKKIQLSVKFA